MNANNNYKRKTREMDDVTRQKISNSLRGRKKSAQHCQNISNGLKKAWENIPYKNNAEH